MATEVERLITLLEARITGYERELKKASQVANREARAIERRFGQMNGTLERQFATSARAIGAGVGRINGLLGGIGVGISVGAIVNLGRSALRLADDLQDTAEQLGVSTDALQVFRFAAAETGVEAAKMDTAILKLNTTIGAAASGDEAAQKKFQALGIAFTDASGKARGAEAVLGDLANLIQSLPTAAERAAAAAELLGERAGPRLVVLLSQGAEGLRRYEEQARAAFQVMSTETIADLAKAQREIEKFTTGLTIAAGGFLSFVNDFDTGLKQTNAEARIPRITRDIERLSAALAAMPENTSPARRAQVEAELAAARAELLAAQRMAGVLPPQARSGRGFQFTPPAGDGSIDLGGGGDDHDARFRELMRELEVIGKQREATAERIDAEQFGIEQQRLKLQGLEREAEIEEAIRAARKDDPNITEAEIERLRTLAGLRFDLLHTLSDEEQRKKNIEEADKRLNDLMSTRNALQEQLSVFVQQGNTDKIKETEAAIAGVNAQILPSIDGVIAFWQAVGGAEAEAAIARLQALKLGLENTGETAAITGQQINNMLASGLTSAADQFVQSIMQGEDAIKSAGQAFQQFAADFLRQIAMMILQTAILAALQAATGTSGTGVGGGGGGASGGGGAGGFLAGIIGSLFHSGGKAGRSGPSRRVPAAAFLGAPRLHDGNVPGLKSDEVAAILQKGEPVISLPQVRKARQAMAAPGGGAAPDVVLRNYNLFDSAQVMSEALATPVGQRAFINVVRENASAINGALGRGQARQA